VLGALEPHKAKLLVLDGIAAKSRRFGPGGNGHDKGMGHMLTAEKLLVGPSGVGEFSHLPDGSAGGISIDQAVADRTTGARFRSLEFGVAATLDTKRQLTSRMCYRGPFQVLPPENDPSQGFRSLFGAGLPAGPAGDAALLRLQRQRKSVLDKVARDLAGLQPRVSAGDRRKLDSHLTALREVETSLVTPPAGSRGAACSMSAVPARLDPLRIDNYPMIGRSQMDLLVLALACEVTQVASLQWSTAQSGTRFPWLGIAEYHHALSHEADDTAVAREKLTAIDAWYGEQFAYLLKKLDAIDEGNGSLLDHSIVMWVNEQGNGDKHSDVDVPHVLAGGRGLFRTGRLVDCGHRAVNDLFVSLLHAFGAEEVTSFGHAPVCRGPLPGLT
jgi:hypothetical protein